jgi:hypothetical protein
VRNGAIGLLWTRKRIVCLRAGLAGDEWDWCAVKTRKNEYYPMSLFLGESHEKVAVAEAGPCR